MGICVLGRIQGTGFNLLEAKSMIAAVRTNTARIPLTFQTVRE